MIVTRTINLSEMIQTLEGDIEKAKPKFRELVKEGQLPKKESKEFYINLLAILTMMRRLNNSDLMFPRTATVTFDVEF